jgi:transposase
MAHKITLDEKSKKELKQRKKDERDGKILRRLMSIEMKSKGMRNKEIAEYCSVCIDTITDWFHIFNQGGFKELCVLQYEGRRVSKLEEYKSDIKKKEKEEGIESLKELKQWIEEEYGIKTCVSNLYYFCKKNSIFLIKRQD